MQEDDHEGSGIVAHFPAHAGQPLSCMSFDPRYVSTSFPGFSLFLRTLGTRLGMFLSRPTFNLDVLIGLENCTFLGLLLVIRPSYSFVWKMFSQYIKSL